MNLELQIRNPRFFRGITHMGDRFSRELLAVNVDFSDAILDTIKTNASGRPGPNIQTGEYKKSTRIAEVTDTKIVFTSDAPQAARLEYGFVGKDSLGREYAQPPYPHFRPAIWYWTRPWKNALAKAARRAVLGR